MQTPAAASAAVDGGGAAGRRPAICWRRSRPARVRPPAFRSGVEVVTVDVGVVDRQGQPLRGLGPGDFTVTVAGQPRRVVTAEFVDCRPRGAELRRRGPTAAPISTNEGGGIGRLFVFIVDQNTLDPGSARQVARRRVALLLDG